MDPISVFSKFLKVEPEKGKFLLGGLALLAAVAIVQTWFLNPTVEGQIESGDMAKWIALILGSAVFVKLTASFTGMILQMLKWWMAIVFSATISLFVVQALSGDALTPRVISSGCFFEIFNKHSGCFTGRQAPEIDPGVIDFEPINDPLLVPEHSQVFIQFAGAITRDEIVGIAQELAVLGWKIVDPSRGGQRTSASAGLNEIRYFHEADLAAATQLAGSLSTIWDSSDRISIRDFSSSGIPAKIGHLEAWISN